MSHYMWQPPFCIRGCGGWSRSPFGCWLPPCLTRGRWVMAGGCSTNRLLSEHPEVQGAFSAIELSLNTTNVRWRVGWTATGVAGHVWKDSWKLQHIWAMEAAAVCNLWAWNGITVLVPCIYGGPFLDLFPPILSHQKSKWAGHGPSAR